MGILNRHNGNEVAEFVNLKMPNLIKTSLNNDMDKNKTISIKQNKKNIIINSIKQAIINLDKEVYKKFNDRALKTGATLILVILLDNEIITFNLGDSLALVFNDSNLVPLNSEMRPVKLKVKSF